MQEEMFKKHECTHIKTHNKHKVWICMECVCVQLDLFKAKQAQEIYLWCFSSLRSLSRAIEHDHLSPKLPFTNNPNMWFVHEISQSKTGNPYIVHTFSLELSAH